MVPINISINDGIFLSGRFPNRQQVIENPSTMPSRFTKTLNPNLVTCHQRIAEEESTAAVSAGLSVIGAEDLLAENYRKGSCQSKHP
ncbi:MAG: hypothetical protein MZV64_35795 [Ignavibacteriales bacterium]|nr:hypothetical protein [Ignavibacteriales bacterium]